MQQSIRPAASPAAPLDWDDVRLFLALCRARTVGDAAAALGVDASTVSRRLAALELVVGAALFERGRSGVRRTEAAEALMPVAEEIEGAMTRFTGAAEGLDRAVTGSVRVTCPSDVAEALVVPLLHDLLARHPALRIAIDAREQLLDLGRREADIALRVVRPARGDLVVTRLRAVRWVLATTPAHARALGTLTAWSDVGWIACDRMSGVGPARWLSTHAPGLDPLLRSDSLTIQIAGVRAGLGCALLPELGLAHYGLVPVPLGAALRRESSTWPADELFLVTHRALRDVPRVRAVWDQLVAHLGEGGGGRMRPRSHETPRAPGARCAAHEHPEEDLDHRRGQHRR